MQTITRNERFGVGGYARLALGIARSMRIYYASGDRRRAMARLYGRFLRPGDLAFDIGAHVGDRTGCFLALGCRVVAVEPQPALALFLRCAYRGSATRVVQAAIGRRCGELSLSLNLANPTIATGSSRFIAAAQHSQRWSAERWTRRVTVPMTTLDALIAAHGVPAFIKIDVEGFEAEALAGLSTAVPALSFEFTTLQRGVARRALARCQRLGPYRFNAAIGESQSLVFSSWRAARDIESWLKRLPDDANSGDVYALAA